METCFGREVGQISFRGQPGTYILLPPWDTLGLLWLWPKLPLLQGFLATLPPLHRAGGSERKNSAGGEFPVQSKASKGLILRCTKPKGNKPCSLQPPGWKGAPPAVRARGPEPTPREGLEKESGWLDSESKGNGQRLLFIQSE